MHILEHLGHLEIVLDSSSLEGIEVGEVDPQENCQIGGDIGNQADHSIAGAEDHTGTDSPEETDDNVIAKSISGVLESVLILGEVLDGELGAHLDGADSKLHTGEENGFTDDFHVVHERSKSWFDN